MVRTFEIKLNAAHPELPLFEASAIVGSASTAFIRRVPASVGSWRITKVYAQAKYPDDSEITIAAAKGAEGVWTATIPATEYSGRVKSGFTILADAIDENGDPVSGYVLGIADFAVYTRDLTITPGVPSYGLHYFNAAPDPAKVGDVASIDGDLKLYNGTAWVGFSAESISNLSEELSRLSDNLAANYYTKSQADTLLAGKVPTSRKVNGKALSSDVELTGEDIPAFDGSSRSVWNAIYSVGSDAAQAVTKADAAVDTANGVAGAFTQHADNTTIHVTAAEKSTWNGKQNALSQAQLDNIAAIPNKANRAANPTAGNLASLDANGNPTDSGITKGKIDALEGKFPVVAADIADGAVTNAKLSNEAVSGAKIRDKTITRGKIADSAVDSTPTAESNNLVTSGGVKSALDGMRDKLDLEVYDFLPETWEVSNTLYSGGTYTWDAATNQWLGASGQRSIRAKAGSTNTYQFVIDPGRPGEATVCEWQGTAAQDVPFEYGGESYVVTVEGRGNAGLKPTGDTLALTSQVVKTPVYNGQNHAFLSATDLVPGEDFSAVGVHRWTCPRKGIVYMRLISGTNSATVRIGVNVAAGATAVDDAHCITALSQFKNNDNIIVPLFLTAGDEVCLSVATNSLQYVLFTCFYTD